MQPEIAHSNRPMQLVRWFFLGRQDAMELPALRWWNRQRLPYNLRLIGCLLLGQLLLLSVGYTEGLILSDEVMARVTTALYSDLLLILLLNLLYFLLPWLEVAIFKGRPERFRTYTFAFINTVSLLFLAFALFILLLTL